MNHSTYIVDQNGERRAGCFGNAIRYGIGLPLIGFLLWVLFSMCGCKTQCVPELIETHDTIVRVDSFISERVRDSIVYKEREDSIYERVRDSISVRQKGDTVWVEKYHESEKFKGSSKTTNETTNKATAEKSKSSDKEKATGQQVIVKETRYIPKFYKFTMWFFWIIVVLILLRVAWYVLDKIPATKPYTTAIKGIFKIGKFF